MLFYYTNDESLLSYYIHIFLKNHPSCESIDASLYTSEDINQKISQINLFENQHNFLFHHFNILKQKTFINIEEDSSVFFILCDKPNPFLLQNGKLLKPFGRTDFVKLIDSLLKDKKVQNEQVYDLIIENSNKNPLVIQNNIYSLYYYDDKKEITEEMVNCIFQKPSNDNIFSFLSHILFCDFQKTFSSLNQFALLKINGINIINAISSNLFTLKIIKMCNCDDISSLSLILKTPL
jgi:DNA polymerase III delta subunit